MAGRRCNSWINSMRKPMVQGAALGMAVLLGSTSALAQSVAAGANLWAFNSVANPTGQGCAGCHGTPATIPQVNAANAVSVLNSAITNNAGLAMAAFAGLSATDRASLALYIGSTTTQTQATAVNFGGSTAIALNNIATTAGTSQVITALSTVTGPSRGNLSAYNNAAASVTYTHTASSCTADSFTFRGTGLSGAATSNRTVTISVNPPAAPTSSNSTSNIAYSTAPTAIPLTLGGGTTSSISVSGLSPAVGTLSVAGTSVTYTASSTQYAPTVTFTYQAVGPCASSAASTVTINVAAPPAPVITSTNTASGTGGQPFSYAIIATNVPTMYSSTALPAGLTLNPTTGLISGTPTVTGVFPVTLSATNGSGTGTLPLSITIALVTPVITSALAANATSGAAFTYTITANNLPASFNATGLPTGLTINTANGVISGTPVVAVGGPVNVAISATNATGTDSKTLVLTVSLNAPTFTSATSTSGTSGQAFSFQITATDFPSSYAATGLPAGLTLNTTTGLISGTAVVSATTTFSVMLTATNGSGSTNQTLSITITLAPPTITSAATASGAATLPFSYQIAASGAPTSFGATGLPAGLTVNTTTGLVSGVPVAAGVSTATVTATNASGTGSRAVTITIGNQPPPTVSGLSTNVAFNTPITIDLTPFVSGGATSIAIASPPAHGTAVVSGFSVTYTPTTDFFGADSFLFTSSGPGGTSAPANVSLLVATPAAPTAAARTATVQFNTATPIDLTAAISGVGTTIAVTVAPAHGTTSVAGKVVTYTPATDFFGDDVFTYTVTGPGGTSAGADVTIKVTALVPTGAGVNFILPVNTQTTLDLAPFIKGSAITGVTTVGAPPQHGTVTVSGTKVIFTPKKDYFGSDSFSYVAFGIAGKSAPAAVKVTIVGRPDPSKDAIVTGLVAAQTDAAKRFSRAQISNFQSRMESLHRGDVGTVVAPTRATDVGRTGIASKQLPDNTNVRPDGAVNAKESGFLHSSFANAPAFPDSTSAAPSRVAFLSDAMSLLTSGSINLASIGNTARIAAQGGATAPSLWLSGSAQFGSRTATGERSGLDFTTSGISMGIDRRLGEQLVAGVGVGFARDNTDIGTDGSRSRARAYTGVAYGSYQPTAQIFVDGLIGIGSLDFKSRRYVTPIEEIANANRKGRQIFGSIASGYEYRNNGVLISPYARLDYASDRLNQVTETGAGPYALTYFQQTTPSIQGVLGVRAESVHATSFGYAAPRLRAEYRHDFQGERQTSIGYADGIGGRFGLSTGAVTRNALVVGLGSEFVYRGGWTLGVDYQFEHTSSLSRDSSQGIRFTITKDLDGKDSPYSLIAAAVTPRRPIDVQVDAGFMFDSNVTRGKLSYDKLSDRVYSVNANKSKLFEINDNVRATVSGSVGGEKFDNFYRLSHATAALQGEIVYRPSAAFDAPTFGAFAQASAEYYQSTLRNGYRYAFGVSARKPLTDRIEIVGTLSHNERYGKSSVFNNRFNAVRVNADYSLESNRTIYLTGEYRRGQIVSTGLPSLENIEIADVFVQDDAYPGGQFFSYRFDGRTVLSTLGYNLGLGARHSLDLSWRRAQSTPNFRPSFATSPRSYIADQYSIVYLVRF